MKTVVQWTTMTLYLGVGIITGSVIALGKSFEIGMAIGGGIAIISAGIYACCVWKTLRETRKDENKSSISDS